MIAGNKTDYLYKDDLMRTSIELKEIVALDIVLSPIDMTNYAGETLRVMISSKDKIGSVMLGTLGCITHNKEIHVLHTGGKYASYLQMPLIK